MLIGLLKSLALVRASHKEKTSTPMLTTTGMVLLLGFAGIYTIIHLLSWALVRYRLPVDAILVIFAGAGVVEISRMLKTIHRHKSMLGL